ncbi:MAG: type II toxin-antitoxin system ParD family antitoxin [Geminicoccaceae bacterium]
MTVKPTISLTDQAHAFARGLVASGRFASLSAVVQHGLRLVEREEALQQARLEAIRTDLERRAAQAPISLAELDERLTIWRAARDAGEDSDLA